MISVARILRKASVKARSHRRQIRQSGRAGKRKAGKPPRQAGKTGEIRVGEPDRSRIDFFRPPALSALPRPVKTPDDAGAAVSRLDCKHPVDKMQIAFTMSERTAAFSAELLIDLIKQYPVLYNKSDETAERRKYSD